MLALEPLGDDRQPPGNVARHLGRALGRVERQRLGPDATQPLLHFGQQQLVHGDAIPLPVGEMRVVLPLPRKVGVDLQHVPHIQHQQERRIAVLHRQRPRIALRLVARRQHRPVPAAGAASGRPQLHLRRVLRQQVQLVAMRPGLAQARLLRFQHEAAALVEVDPPRRSRPIRMLEADPPLICIVVLRVIGGAERRCRQAQRVAETLDELLRVGNLAAARSLRRRNKCRKSVSIDASL